MLKGYKYCILPSEEQKTLITQIFGCCRLVYNLGLEEKIMVWKQRQKNVSGFDLINQLPELKKEYEWLKDVPSQSLQKSLVNLDVAFTNFFKHGAKFPRFKSKKHRQSFQIPSGIKVDFDSWKIFLPKLKWIPLCRDRKIKGEIKSATVSKSATNKYFVSILVEDGKELPQKKPIKQKTAIGIDVGLTHFAILSNGQKIDNPRFLKGNLKRLRIEQRTMARRFKKGKEQSNNWYKQKLAVAKIHEKITNQRNDFLHKLSTSIIKKYNTICIENLNVAGMIKNRNLSQAISDVGWSEFFRQLKYKSDWYGKNLIPIGQFEASSKICSNCGHINKELKLTDREWRCPTCKTMLDRDINAAINIKDFGVRANPLNANVEVLNSSVV